MELNLDRLNSLFSAGDLKKRAAELPTEPQTGQEEYRNTGRQENQPERELEGLELLQRKADQSGDKITRSIAIYEEYQRNTIESSQLRAEIAKGVKAGEDIYSLFLKAAKAISIMTHNSLFYSGVKEDLIAVYGTGLQEESPLHTELKDLKRRLERLKEAESRELDPDNKRRLQTAIAAHRAKGAELENILEQRKTQL